jgi:DNA-directed RNA polymerase
LAGSGVRRDEKSIERAIEEAAGNLFYGNARLIETAEAATSAEERSAGRRRIRVLEGKIKVSRKQTLAEHNRKLRKTQRAVWWHLIKDVPRHDIVRAGAWLLACVAEADIVVVVDKQLLPTRKYEEDIRRLMRFIVRRNVQLLPSTSKPAHWTAPSIQRNGLKRQFLHHWNPELQDKIAASFKLPTFRQQHLRAVNTLGDVPLRIDEWTLRLVERFAADVETYRDEDRRLADRSRIAEEVEAAARCLRRDVFFNSYCIDFRGRLNAEQPFNFQQQDRVRSLYRFARGVPIGPGDRSGYGLWWLMVHAANCYGKDKLPYDARVAWTKEHWSDIERVATDPEHFDWWRAKEVDKPFAFAAACRELINSNDNPHYETTLPCAFDHTASGIQHLALIGLDEKTADLVNLTPRDAPHDIYGALANRTVELFDNSEEAEYWRDLFSKSERRDIRTLLKQPGMTFSYASTDRGNIRQVQDAFFDVYESDPPAFNRLRYLVGRFRTACKEMLAGPVRTMIHIQKFVTKCNKRKRFLEWPSPSGVLVGNVYPKKRKVGPHLGPRIWMPGGSRHVLAEHIPGTVDGTETRNSAVANFVHSMDAAHLVRTVNALADNEMPALCVHDSFAVLAPHVEQFHISNREELALMYNELFEHGGPLALLQHCNSIDAPPPPSGNFNLWQVQQATYACS